MTAVAAPPAAASLQAPTAVSIATALAPSDDCNLPPLTVISHLSWHPSLGKKPPPLRWPLATPALITSPFGERIHPIEGVLRLHAGVDVAAARGQPVQAAAPGRVVSAGWLGAHGFQVELMHAGGLRTRYSHLSELLVEVGANVDAGSALGLAGDTGLATGVHLHFEVWRKGRARNPMGWFHHRAPHHRRVYVTRATRPKGSS